MLLRGLRSRAALGLFFGDSDGGRVCGRRLWRRGLRPEPCRLAVLLAELRTMQPNEPSDGHGGSFRADVPARPALVIEDFNLALANCAGLAICHGSLLDRWRF